MKPNQHTAPGKRAASAKSPVPPAASKPRGFWRRFRAFAFGREQRPERLIPTLTGVLAFILLIVCYPLPNTMSDSMGYVEFAARNAFTFFRPTGYAQFLRFAAFFSSAVQNVMIVQMLFYILATAFILLVLRYYFPVRRTWLRLALDLGIALHPAALYMTFTLMSDVLFCLLIYLMLTFLIIYAHERNLVSFLGFLLAFWALLYVRYSAMFFPLAIVPMLLVLRGRVKWLLLVPVALILVQFHHNISRNMEDIYGKRQFSTGFDGWQLLNNAIHALPYIETDSLRFDELEMQNLHLFLSLRKEQIAEATRGGTEATASLMWQKDYPLKQYLGYRQTLKIDKDKSYGYLWIELAGLYRRYGTYLILHYPGAFIKHYLWPNVKQIFLPSHYDIMGPYREVAIDNTYLPAWFGLPGNLVLRARHDFFPKMTPGLTVYECLTWLLWLCAAVMLLLKKKQLQIPAGTAWTLWLLVCFAFVYYATTTFASPVVLRYWLPMHLCKWAFAGIVCHLFEQKQEISQS
ncbi:MAG: hypothetical protein IJL64_00540 [Bacteroidales bacterium]|nr:hypothetical protein [Bacteroidales bacterium]